jgi:hypothetical protein
VIARRVASYLEGERLATNSDLARAQQSLGVVTEKAFMQTVLDLAHLTGWTSYHTHDSRRSTAGFPDLVLLRRERCIVAELKRDGKLPTPVQMSWLLLFAQVPGVHATCWHPAQWEQIQEALR